MKITIRKKLMISFCALIFVFFMGQLIYNSFFAKKVFIYEKSIVLEKAFDEMKKEDIKTTDDLGDKAEEIQDIYGIRISIYDGESLIYSNQRKSKTIEQIEFSSFEDKPKPKVIERENKRSLLTLKGKFQSKGDTIYALMTTPMSRIEQDISDFAKSEFLVLLACLVVAVIIAEIISRSFILPIQNIKETAGHIAKCDFSCHADENEGVKELNELAESINQMSENMKNSMSELNVVNKQLQKEVDYRKQIENYRKEFIAAVSHEMKTPLGLLQIYAENLKNYGCSIDKESYYDVIFEEINTLDSMITKMLEISSLDNGFTQLDIQKINLTKMIQKIIHEMNPLLCDYQFDAEYDDEVFLEGDRNYIEMVLKNLMNNAIQYTMHQNRIRLTMKERDNSIRICVFNEGTSISEENSERIWDAFYREDTARTRTKDNNVGLGLYVVKLITEMHGGECWMQNVENGVEFHLKFNKIVS